MRRAAFIAISFTLALSPSMAGEDEWDGSPAVATTAPGTPSALPGTSRQLQLLKVRAGGLYRARQYKAALETYAACARLAPSDPAVRNDLAACLMKLGMRDSAAASAREALRLAGRGLAADVSEWSFSDASARKTAYFLLDRLGGRMAPPPAGRCESWAAASGCPARLHVCAEEGRREVPGGTLRWGILRAGLTRAKALFDHEEVGGPGHAPHPELRDLESLAIDGDPESRSLWINRDSAATLPLGEWLETSDPACAGSACGRLERERIGCRVLHFDPCAGVVGMACARQDEGGPDRVVVGEFYLIPAR